MITGKPNWKAYLWPFDITCSANAYVTLVRDRHFPIWSCFPTMWTITIIFPRSDTQYLVLVQCLHYSQMAQRKSQMFWRNVSVALNAVERLHSTEVRRAVNRTCKFIVRQKKQRSAVESQAAQTLFVIYIRDSIALRLNHLRECMKMVRKSL